MKHRLQPVRNLVSPVLPLLTALAVVTTLASEAGCAKVKETSPSGTGKMGRLITGLGGRNNTTNPPPPPCADNLCQNFPTDPIVTDPKSNPPVPTNPSRMFSSTPPT